MRSSQQQLSSNDASSLQLRDSFVQDMSPKVGLASYFDINRMMKIEEKFESEEAVEILRKVIAEMISI